ncbi:MAG: glycosyltransferase family 4 protein [Ferruginibacter sp.]|nr:glycosyltransferase family 4 protein [Ferruginibacter sp.]
MKPKLIRITTVPMALKYLLAGQMQFMQQNGFDVLMISADGKELQDVIANENCRHVLVPMTRKITPFQDLKCLFQLIKIFKKEKPTIVHTHTPKAGLLGMLAAKLCGVKVRIHTVAGLPLMVETGFKYQLLKFIEKLTYSAATHIWPNSNSLLQFIQHKKLAGNSKLSVIGKGSSNGINTNRFNKTNLDATILENVKASFKYNPSNIYLLCIGRLVKDKGIPELVQTFVALQHNYRNLKLILVGDFEEQLDPLPQETQHQIKYNGDIKHITWTEHVEYYMALANYFVFPSHREGFPNVLLQAGAMQLPIICSQIEGNVDIVTHQQTGLIFAKQNIEQLQKHIEYAIANPAHMQQMANELYSIVQTDYKRENMWQNILQQYKSLLSFRR